MTKNIEKIVGMNVEDAKIFLKNHGLSLRVMQCDGEHLMGTCDMRSKRLNVAVEKGRVIELLQVG